METSMEDWVAFLFVSWRFFIVELASATLFVSSSSSMETSMEDWVAFLFVSWTFFIVELASATLFVSSSSSIETKQKIIDVTKWPADTWRGVYRREKNILAYIRVQG